MLWLVVFLENGLYEGWQWDKDLCVQCLRRLMKGGNVKKITSSRFYISIFLGNGQMDGNHKEVWLYIKSEIIVESYNH